MGRAPPPAAITLRRVPPPATITDRPGLVSAAEASRAVFSTSLFIARGDRRGGRGRTQHQRREPGPSLWRVPLGLGPAQATRRPRGWARYCCPGPRH